MRLYRWNPAGRYISHEYVLPQVMVDEQKQDLNRTDAEIEDGIDGQIIAPEEDSVGLPRERFLADPVMREALQRWESGDDSAFQSADAALEVVLQMQNAILDAGEIED